MAPIFLLVMFAGDAPTRQPHPLAPSLPQLTPAEEKRIEQVIGRFIDYDTGKLTGPAGKKALEEFQRLPPEAIFVLVDGFNRAANMEASCPAVVIGKKIMTIVNGSLDLDLISFVKENIGAVVTAKRHKGLIQDMHFGLTLRRGAVQKRLAANPKLAPPRYGAPSAIGDKKDPKKMSLAELVRAAGQERGPLLRAILTEAAQREGPQVLEVLAIASASYDKDIAQLGQTLLDQRLARQSVSALRELLAHDRPQVRAGAIAAASQRGLKWGGEFIDRLRAEDQDVVQAARRALVPLAGPVTHGRGRGAGSQERAAAIQRWQAWWRP